MGVAQELAATPSPLATAGINASSRRNRGSQRFDRLSCVCRHETGRRRPDQGAALESSNCRSAISVSGWPRQGRAGLAALAWREPRRFSRSPPRTTREGQAAGRNRVGCLRRRASVNNCSPSCRTTLERLAGLVPLAVINLQARPQLKRVQKSQPRHILLLPRSAGASQGLQRGGGLAGRLEGRILIAHVTGQPSELRAERQPI